MQSSVGLKLLSIKNFNSVVDTYTNGAMANNTRFLSHAIIRRTYAQPYNTEPQKVQSFENARFSTSFAAYSIVGLVPRLNRSRFNP